MNKLLLCTLSLTLLSGCALSSGVAGVSGASVYSAHSKTADSLTADGENRVVWRAKKELYDEIFREQNTSPKGKDDDVKKNY
jgi:hypothetical protein